MGSSLNIHSCKIPGSRNQVRDARHFCLQASQTHSRAMARLAAIVLRPTVMMMGNSAVNHDVALKFFEKHGVKLSRNFAVEVGLSDKKKHCFDLGSANPKIIVECKSHKWTAGANVPSAKMTVWNEAMYYFHLAPKAFRKILFVLHDRRSKDGESLLSYYKRTYSHMIPEGVEFLEWDEATGDIIKL